MSLSTFPAGGRAAEVPPEAQEGAPSAAGEPGRAAEAEAAAQEATEEEDDDYAEAGVLELGGRLGVNWSEDTFGIEGSPSIGYFVVEFVELSAIARISYVNQRDADTGEREKTQAYALVLEPSYHVPLREGLFVFGGLGVGVGHDGDDFDFEMIPRVGLNISVTLHGILSPSVSVPIVMDADGTVVGLATEVGYTVAF
ncbi:MAG TPA: hypothetical protein VKY73_01940 [Polyangiaceae bacterium]|nr:hypothetical protein [Polyangiaceae bacterium]